MSGQSNAPHEGNAGGADKEPNTEHDHSIEPGRQSFRERHAASLAANGVTPKPKPRSAPVMVGTATAARRGKGGRKPAPWEGPIPLDMLEHEVNVLRARREARRIVDAADQAVTADTPTADGAAFILDQPDKVPARWGDAEEVLWGKGEALMIVGPPGVGKTTLVGQLVRALLGLDDAVLGYSVEPVGRVLYLAMDRPRQIGRALARVFTETDRATLAGRLAVHQGPPPADLAANPDTLLDMARAAGVDVVVVDSLKDAAVGLSEDAVGAGYNRARQKLLAAGIDVVELHHQRKAGSNGGKPNTLSDVYGSTWLTSGAGSVVLLWADEAGANVVHLSHLKPVMEPVGPFDVIHDHTAGRSRVDGTVDLVQLAGANARGMTVGMAAEALFGVEKASKDQREKARRRVQKLVDTGLLEVAEPISDGKGHGLSTYRPTKRRGPATPVLDLDGLR